MLLVYVPQRNHNGITLYYSVVKKGNHVLSRISETDGNPSTSIGLWEKDPTN
jgi:hypothetical protein